MSASSFTLRLLVALGIFLPFCAHADTAGDLPPPVEIELLDTGDDAELLTDGASPSAATAIVVVKQVLVGNEVVQDGIQGLALLQGSFNDGRGLFGVNQDAGNFNNQANAVAFVFGDGETFSQLLALSIEIEHHDNVVISNNSTQEVHIEGSFNGTKGIVGVNQTAGSGNSQINAMAVGVGVMLGEDAIVLHDTDLEGVLGDDDGPGNDPPSEIPTSVDSFQGFEGIAQVSQANGNLNRVQNALTVSVFGVEGPLP